MDELQGLLEDVLLNIRLHMWFQLDGEPPHFGFAIRNLVTVKYPRWIGRGSTMVCPPRLRDHNPLIFIYEMI